MKRFNWSPQKNEWLTHVRGVSFERVLHAIDHGGLLDIVGHHNPSKYPNQQILVVEIDDYAYVVPFVESDDEYFLKTIIPSRKATKQYLRNVNG